MKTILNAKLSSSCFNEKPLICTQIAKVTVLCYMWCTLIVLFRSCFFAISRTIELFTFRFSPANCKMLVGLESANNCKMLVGLRNFVSDVFKWYLNSGYRAYPLPRQKSTDSSNSNFSLSLPFPLCSTKIRKSIFNKYLLASLCQVIRYTLLTLILSLIN